MRQCQLFEMAAAEQRSGTCMNAGENSVFSLGTNRMRTVLFQNGIRRGLLYKYQKRCDTARILFVRVN